jgi:hypothetical protein
VKSEEKQATWASTARRSPKMSTLLVIPRDGNLGMGTGTIFYPRVAPVPDPNQDRYGTGIFFHLWVTRRVPNTLLPL